MKNLIGTLISVIALSILAPEAARSQAATDVDCAGCVDGSDIAQLTITTSNIRRNAVAGSKIAQFAVSQDKIRSGAVTGSKIAQFAVSQDKIRQSAVNGSKIAQFAVSTDKIRQDAVTASKIAPNAVGITQIDPTQVQQRVTGVCPPGSFITGISQIGSVTCAQSGVGGDGSAGDLVVSGIVNWISSPPANPNFANITIEVAGQLTVPAGTTISCSGNFLNNGTLAVQGGAQNNGTSFAVTDNGSIGYASAANPADALRSANGPDWHDNSIADTESLSGGFGGIGIPQATIVTSLKRLRIGGGSGGGVISGAAGGGLVVVKCAGSVTNSAAINADGVQGNVATGGGGGGIVVLASSSIVDNSGGTISARGGVGGSENTSCCAPGGGGGGGIVVSVAPSVNNAGGVIDVSGGAGVTAVGTPSTMSRSGGGGGGASGGDGGTGGGGGASNGSSGAGNPGYSLELVVNPATVL